MLQELAAYAREHGLAARAGFKPKKLKAYVLLSADGRFLGIQVRDKAAPDVYAPDIGSAANGTRYCNPLVEKAKIPLCIIEDEQKDANVPTKHQFTLSMLDAGGAYDPALAVAAAALRSEGYTADEHVAQEMVTLASRAARDMGLTPYYLYRQKYMEGNLENVGYCKPDKPSIYNVDIMEEIAPIAAFGAGAISKWLYPAARYIERAPNVKNIESYIARVDEMAQRKRELWNKA